MVNYKDFSQQFKENFNDWICYYRLNIHRFAMEYFGLKLHTFQQILLYCMSKPNFDKLTTFDWFASRGLGKSFITMVFAVIMCTLYPGLEIVVASASAKSAREFMKKINELMEYPNIAREILPNGIVFNKEESIIKFKNSSIIYSKVCNDNARGSRCQVLIFDERNIMDSEVIRKIFIPMLTKRRNIPSYRKPEYKKYRNQEHNYKIYLTSVGYSDDDAYKEFEQFSEFMEQGDECYDTFSLPYQFGVEADIIDASLMVSQAKENKQNIEDFRSEMEVIPIGSSANAIFNHSEIKKSRQITTPLVEPTIKQYFEVNGDLSKLPMYSPKQYGEIRVLSVDIAVALGRVNDASAWTVFKLFEKNDYYEKHVVFHKAVNGMNIDNQVLYTKRLWSWFDIDYIVFDMGGAIGISFANLLGNVTPDIQLNKTYPGMKTMNQNDKVDIRVVDQNAIPVLYAMIVSGAGASQIQADISFIAKNNFERKQIFMPVDEFTAIDELNDRYKYMKYKTSNDYNDREIADNMISTFVNTNELAHEMVSVKMKRLPSGRNTLDEGNERKDRLISLLYGCYFINELEQDLQVIERKNDLSAYAQAMNNSKASIAAANPFANRGSFTNGFATRR